MAKGSLQTFRSIFTSPSSAELTEGADVHRYKAQRTSGECRTRCDVAGLLKMQQTEPRAIAYIAVQVYTSSIDSI